MDNRISAELTPANKTVILTKLGEIEALLPFLLNLTVEEKSSLPKMSTFRDGMDEAFAMEMAAHPDLVPTFVDMAEVAKDRAVRSALRDVFQQISALCEGVEDTQTAAGVDTYLAYLSFYNNVKQAAKRNVPGANTILDNLKRFFPRGGSSPTPAPTHNRLNFNNLGCETTVRRGANSDLGGQKSDLRGQKSDRKPAIFHLKGANPEVQPRDFELGGPSAEVLGSRSDRTGRPFHRNASMFDRRGESVPPRLRPICEPCAVEFPPLPPSFNRPCPLIPPNPPTVRRSPPRKCGGN